MVYKCFDKKSTGGGIGNNNYNNNNNIKQNLQLAEELHKPIIKKLKSEKFILDLEIIFGVPICQIALKKFLLLVKLKIQFHGHMLLMILMEKKLLEHFMKKNCQKLIKKNLE